MSDLFFKIFGVWFGFFVLRIFLRQNFVTEHSLTKLSGLFLLIQAVQLLIFQNFLINFLFIYFSVVCFISIKFISNKSREIRFRKEFPGILTSILLNMKLGQSFRQALRSAHSSLCTSHQAIFEMIYRHVAFPPQEKHTHEVKSGSFCSEMIIELRKIDGSTHKTIEKLENFRRRLIITDKFRRRSGRIRGQVHLQLVLMSLIYVLVFAINAKMFPLQRSPRIVLGSLSAYSLGLILIFIIGKRIRWTL